MSPSPAPAPALAVVHPGSLLGPSNKYTAGPGTHIHENNIYASIAGRPHISKPSSSSSTSSSSLLNPRPTAQSAAAAASSSSLAPPPTTRPTISIPRLLPSPTSAPIPSSAITNKNTLPFVGAVVLCRVTRLTARQVDVRILQVKDNVCGEEWAGVVRREDVRGTEKDRVVIAEGFRVGDFVRGVVISLGDQSNYYLSTATNELGVIMARSEAGNEMVPISWKEFKDPVTGVRERRKVAKPI